MVVLLSTEEWQSLKVQNIDYGWLGGLIRLFFSSNFSINTTQKFGEVRKFHAYKETQEERTNEREKEKEQRNKHTQ